MSIVRDNLMNEPGYSPYCGNEKCRGMWPRASWTGAQFRCHACGWQSSFEPEFIAEYKSKWSTGDDE
ncbi:hypothetical protein BZM27_05800 [Paraburkholderia steynii]|uniref:Uncharacterized protein n=1 Tax=Paraburkholderia steynii TaxID=1245441 RepID=A0A4R0XG82_9BURK|nr:hypothetical protein BZM27_05800 [Paraburkholderia steynii]